MNKEKRKGQKDTPQPFGYKQAIILRIDLNMSCGKAAVQACHGAVSASEETKKRHPQWFRNWMQEGQRKIVLKANSKEELQELEKKAKKLDIPTYLVSDMGLTELPPGTITALGIGPAPSNLIDKVTGTLSLY
ncbi:peptidyl-tRNA hydrolase Pth2 [Candidatus Bathyarchaeota archaeon]|nr:peptidyl-tRNA hydrolase Pth2 [Candidatus Bathyarchaeota archaeon]